MDYKVTDTQLSSIANAIRSRAGIGGSLAFPSAFVSAIQNIPSGITPSGSISISQNGTYDVTAFADAVVDVQGGGSGISEDTLNMLLRLSSGSIHDSVITDVGSSAFFSASHIIGTVEMTACKKVWDSAFYSCKNITEISFPELSIVKTAAFGMCSSLASVYLPKCETLESYAFGDNKKMVSADLPQCTLLSVNAFAQCYSLANASIPKCQKVSQGAFNACSMLSTISLPECTEILASAFAYCVRLVSLYLGGSTICSLSHSNAFRSTPIGGYSASAGAIGSIFVPASLVDSYKAASNWSYFSDRITAIE